MIFVAMIIILTILPMLAFVYFCHKEKMDAIENLFIRKRTKWKRVYNPIIGLRCFDANTYGLGYFTIVKLYQCEQFNPHAETFNYSHWFEQEMMVIKTDYGLTYKLPFKPYLDIQVGDITLAEFYNIHPNFYTKKKC